jgi:acetyltransferase EpsM
MTAPELKMPDFAFDAASVIIFGGGGFGKFALDLVLASRMYRVAGFVDDVIAPGTIIMGVPVLGGAGMLPELYQRGLRLAVNAVGGIGNVAVRVKVFKILADAGFTCPNFVHPTAWVEPQAVLEGGIQVMAKAYVGSEARIGFGTLVNNTVIVSHDCTIGKCTSLSPGAALAGGVVVEDFAQVGMNATVNINVRIGKGARVGNGATVKADVPPGGRVYAGTIWPPRST